jgi:hypothetical protein
MSFQLCMYSFVKVNKNDIDLCSYNLPKRDEFVTKVIKVMIEVNKGIVIQPLVVALGVL